VAWPRLSPAVTLAAVDMLRSGGNAVDAAIAAIALQGVIDPHMTGIGGDCLQSMLRLGPACRHQRLGPSTRKAELGWFRQQGLTSITDDSPHAVTVPGAVDAWCKLAADYGSKGLDDPGARNPCCRTVCYRPPALDWARYADRMKDARPASRSIYLAVLFLISVATNPCGARRDAAPDRARGTRRVLRGRSRRRDRGDVEGTRRADAA
jgi:hypothetical protein